MYFANKQGFYTKFFKIATHKNNDKSWKKNQTQVPNILPIDLTNDCKKRKFEKNMANSLQLIISLILTYIDFCKLLAICEHNINHIWCQSFASP